MTLAEIDAKLAQIEQESQGTPFERMRVRYLRQMWQQLRTSIEAAGPT